MLCLRAYRNPIDTVLYRLLARLAGARIEATEVKQQTPDWPGNDDTHSRPIDLNVHDLPHASSTTEWWYTNGHCVLESKRSFAYFAAFFRKVAGYHPVTRAPRYTHSLTWAIYDVSGARSTFVSRVDASASQEGLRRTSCRASLRRLRVP